jgi:hypothetical protein
MKARISFMMGISVALLLVTGCTKDLSTGRTFTEFEKPPEGKATIYLVRDDNFMAGKVPYARIFATDVPSSVTTAPQEKEKYSQVAIVGKDMFVSILAIPGDYYFRRTITSDRISVKSGDIVCIDIGSKYRGITFHATERVESLEQCKQMLTGKQEGAQLHEAELRIGWETSKKIDPKTANDQIVIGKDMKW